MPIFLDQGVHDLEEETALPPNAIAESQGMEYRRDRKGLFKAAGRQLVDTNSEAVLGLYYAGFDGNSNKMVVQTDELLTYKKMALRTRTPFLAGDSDPDEAAKAEFAIPAGAEQITGTHFNNRHYVFLGGANAVLDPEGDGLWRAGGMEQTHTFVTLSTSGTGNLGTQVGCYYWVTEWDDINKVESIAGPVSELFDFTDVEKVVMTLSANAAVNPNTTHYRLYRTPDSGTFPIGGRIATVPVGSDPAEDTTTPQNGLVPTYPVVSKGGVLEEQDKPMPSMLTGTSFQGSLVGIASGRLRNLRYTPQEIPESWPELYSIPLQAENHDIGMRCLEINSMLGVLMERSIHRVIRLSRSSDASFSPGEVSFRVTPERGCVGRKAATVITLGRTQMIVYVSTDGVWATDLFQNVHLTRSVDWDARIDHTKEASIVMVDYSREKKLKMYYWSEADRIANRTYRTGVMEIYYAGNEGKYVEELTVRTLHVDNHSAADCAIAPYAGVYRPYTATGNNDVGAGSIYVEGVQAGDDSGFRQFNNTDADWSFRTVRTQPAGADKSVNISKVYLRWKDPGADITIDRLIETDDDEARNTVDIKSKGKSYQAVDGVERTANTISYQLSGTDSYDHGLMWMEWVGDEVGSLGGDSGS